MDRRALIAAAASLVASGCSVIAPAARRDARVEQVLARWDQDAHPDLHAVVVRQRGAVVAERYFNGTAPDALHDIRSAGKSITSLLIGAAHDRGLIGDLNDPVQRWLPALRGSAIGDVPLRDVLTMRSGLAADDDEPASPGNEDRLDAAPDPVRFLRSVPRQVPPGTLYQDNALTACVAGLVLEAACGRRVVDFGREVLFAPLGIARVEWASDRAGHTKGQGNLSLTARDLAAIGQLVLDRGRHGSTQLLSAAWIGESLQPRIAIGSVDAYADGDGYYWYTKTFEVCGRAVDVAFASGSGGNKLYVLPSLGMVVAITSSAYGRGYGQRRSQAILQALLRDC